MMGRNRWYSPGQGERRGFSAPGTSWRAIVVAVPIALRTCLLMTGLVFLSGNSPAPPRPCKNAPPPVAHLGVHGLGPEITLTPGGQAVARDVNADDVIELVVVGEDPACSAPTLSIAGAYTVTCVDPSAASGQIQTGHVYAENPASPSAGADATRRLLRTSIRIEDLRSGCEAPWVFESLQGEVQATAANASGTTATTAPFAFRYAAGAARTDAGTSPE